MIGLLWSNFDWSRCNFVFVKFDSIAIKTFNWHSPDNSVRNTDTMDYFAYFCTWHIPSSLHDLIRDLLRPSLRYPLECTRPQTLTWQHIKRGLRYCRVFVISGAVLLLLLFYELLIERFFFDVFKEKIEKKRKRIIVRKFWFLSTRIFGGFYIWSSCWWFRAEAGIVNFIFSCRCDFILEYVYCCICSCSFRAG